MKHRERILRRLRKGRWLVRLGWASLAGWLVRHTRRITRYPPRVWHGTYPMHMNHAMVRADRLGGFPGGSVVTHTKLNPSYDLVTSADYDIVLDQSGFQSDELHLAAVCHLLWNADLFVTYFDTHFASPSRPQSTARTLRLLRAAGIRIVAMPNGLDVLQVDRRTFRFYSYADTRLDFPDWDLESDAPLVKARVDNFCRLSDLVIAPDSVLKRFLPRSDLTFKYFPAEVDRLPPHFPTLRETPLIVHAPNNRAAKGTKYLLSALERLRSDGMRFELQLIENMAREDAQKSYAEADIIADQFLVGAYGVFALEGLALGKPVLTYLDEEHLGDPVFNLPIVNANPDNLECVLAVLLAVPELRERLGRAGRAAVERYQCPEALAEVWAQIYRHVWWGEPLELETTRHFAAEREPRSFTEDPALAEFWPVAVEDLMPEIECALGGRTCVA